MRKLTFVLCAVFAVLFDSARASIELTGVVVAGSSVTVGLADSESGVSGWLKRGDQFSGYTVVRYDREAQEVVLRRSDEELRIRLKDAKVKEGQYTIDGEFSAGPAGGARVIGSSLVLGRENRFPLGDDVMLSITPEVRKDGTVLYRSVFQKRSKAGVWEEVASPVVTAIPGQKFSIHIGDGYGFAFTPRAPGGSN